MNRLNVMRLGKSLILNYDQMAHSYHPDTMALCDMDVLQAGPKRGAGDLEKVP
jgi:hypothetical protein